jgi:hypothetical protein
MGYQAKMATKSVNPKKEILVRIPKIFIVSGSLNRVANILFMATIGFELTR